MIIWLIDWVIFSICWFKSINWFNSLFVVLLIACETCFNACRISSWLVYLKALSRFSFASSSRFLMILLCNCLHAFLFFWFIFRSGIADTNLADVNLADVNICDSDWFNDYDRFENSDSSGFILISLIILTEFESTYFSITLSVINLFPFRQ